MKILNQPVSSRTPYPFLASLLIGNASYAVYRNRGRLLAAILHHKACVPHVVHADYGDGTKASIGTASMRLTEMLIYLALDNKFI